MTGDLKVGRFNVPFDQAADMTQRYLDAKRNQISAKPYAFPAYDSYDAEHNVPDRLTDADLLAPVLLNVDISIRSFYGLQRVREHLSGVLQDVGDPRLMEAMDDELAVLVGRAYEVLDDSRKPSGIGGTKLSKVLHRKRPGFFVLHDKQVRACYLGTAAVPHVAQRSSRTWADYMVQVSRAIRDDLNARAEEWQQLLTACSSDTNQRVTLVRLFDIVAWHVGSSRTTSTDQVPHGEEDE